MISPLPWLGGKHYSATKIVAAFPPAAWYASYIEPFGGAASVLLARPPSPTIEIFNDLNGDLVNFWLQCREHGQQLQELLAGLPYSRKLYYSYFASLYREQQELAPLERAARYFYVIRGSFSTNEGKKKAAAGWAVSPLRSHAQAYQSALALFPLLQKRLASVAIDNRDFEDVIRIYDSPRSLFYCDPPYVGVENYYKMRFSPDDHTRLAALLNAASACVAVSYYPDPLIDELYPPEKWRRVTWHAVKHSQRTRGARDDSVEMLLCNYAPQQRRGLWD